MAVAVPKPKVIVAWGDLLKVGIPELDKQHKNIIDLMNLVYSEPKPKTLDKLKICFVAHLDTEQRLFEKYNYDATHRKAHNVAHGVMVKLLNDELARVKEGNDIDAEWIKEFAINFKTHAFEYDALYMDYIQAQLAKEDEAKEKEQEREEMKEFMRKKGCYGGNIYKLLVARGVTAPKYLSTLSPDEVEDVLDAAAKTGFMGGGVAKFRDAWKDACKDGMHVNDRDTVAEEVGETLQLAARDQSQAFYKLTRAGRGNLGGGMRGNLGGGMRGGLLG